MLIHIQSILKKLIIAILVTNYSYVSATTVGLKESNDPMENYSFLGAAYLCAKSSNLSATERVEMTQIRMYYRDIVLSQLNLSVVDYSIARSAAYEKFDGLGTFDINYNTCSKVLKN